MAEEPTPFSVLLAGYGTTSLGEGMQAESVFALLKVRAEDGSPAWSVRSGGAPLPAEELLGVLDGLTTSLRQKLSMSWKGQSPPPSTGVKLPPQKFSEMFEGLGTIGVADKYVIESVFAVIKARRADGAKTWFVRSSEMRLNPEERLGALDGYAATVRQNLADTWKW